MTDGPFSPQRRRHRRKDTGPTPEQLAERFRIDGDPEDASCLASRRKGRGRTPKADGQAGPYDARYR